MKKLLSIIMCLVLMVAIGGMVLFANLNIQVSGVPSEPNTWPSPDISGVPAEPNTWPSPDIS